MICQSMIDLFKISKESTKNTLTNVDRDAQRSRVRGRGRVSSGQTRKSIIFFPEVEREKENGSNLVIIQRPIFQ